ncbi:NACHT domain-containing protein [Candidatus Leptofilum sp.]|uniref:NACHT domain-containing protein n=1 Tax=Candidatus Leptofilum sp. TaxID=3241576 RepID=UPI003B5AB4BD
MKLTPAWRNRLRNLTTIFLVLTVVAIIYTLIQWIRSEPGSFEPLNVLFFAVFSVASALSAWLSRPDNVQPPASSEIALAETPAFGSLRQQITKLFSLEELRILCLDVGIRYETLSGDTIDTKAASLLAYADRRGQLNKLMAALQQERPQAKWPVPNTLQNLYDLRRNVRATWIDGVLKQSVTDEIALELNVALEPHSLTRKVAYVPGQADRPVEKEIPQLFADFGSLLILGEPGSGKTMTLLQLAESLLNDAEQDATLLTPVVLNLSSWANEQKSLVDWLVEELWQQYQLPREAGRAIIQNNQLIYLLDGLDEMAEAARNACVQAINLFREQHSGGLAVCCRAEEYEALSHKLNLGMGVRIQSLSKVQVDDYFKRPELALEAVYKLWQTDEAFQKLAKTPLFLSIITLAYRGLNNEQLSKFSTPMTRRNHLFRCYVDEMFKRRPISEQKKYSQAQALKWLTNLAYGMMHHKQSQFFMERLQPTWLLSDRLQRFNAWIYIAIVGFVFGSIFSLFIDMSGGLIFGVFCGFISKLSTNKEAIELYEALYWHFPSRQEFFRKVKRGLIFGLIFGPGFGLIVGLLGGLIVRLSSGFNGGVAGGLVGGLIGGLLIGIIGGFVGGLESCFQASDYRTSLHPNQGIHSSLRRGLVMGLFYGLVGAVLLAIISGLIFGLYSIFSGVLIGGQEIKVAIKTAFSDEGRLVLFVGGIFGGAIGVIGGLIGGFFQYGGQSYVQHYVLRLMLGSQRMLPLVALSIKNPDRVFVDFLDAMKDRVILRRVGGGWMFIHRTLLDYFASLYPHAEVEVDHE